jgi:hypothetical protein
MVTSDRSFVRQITGVTVECGHTTDCPSPDRAFGRLNDWFDNAFSVAESVWRSDGISIPWE